MWKKTFSDDCWIPLMEIFLFNWGFIFVYNTLAFFVGSVLFMPLSRNFWSFFFRLDCLIIPNRAHPPFLLQKIIAVSHGYRFSYPLHHQARVPRATSRISLHLSTVILVYQNGLMTWSPYRKTKLPCTRLWLTRPPIRLYDIGPFVGDVQKLFSAKLLWLVVAKPSY